LVTQSTTSTTPQLITFSTDLSAITTTTTAALSQRTIDVLVGAFSEGNGTDEFLFKPNNITANVGDVVRFNMLGKAHSVTQSQFPRPCIKNGTFDTQLQPNPGNVTGLIFEEFTVNVTTPLWFYCKQTDPVSHCGKGMVFGINPKSQVQMEQFIEMAEAQNGTFGTPPSTSTSAILPDATGAIGKRVNMPRIRGRSAKLF
jgi:plastocyanin